MIFRQLNQICLAAIAAIALLITGCDEATGPEAGGQTTFEGRVTDDAGFGKTSAAVEGAVVTASNVAASGSTNRVEGQSTTNAQGRFELEAEDISNEVVLTAEKGAFKSKAMVYAEGTSTVRSMPMTTETHGEAEVFVEARKQDENDDATMSDIAVYVTEEVAAEAAADAQTASEVAGTIVVESRTRRDYMREEDNDEDVEKARQRENEAFIDLQASLAASSGTSAETAALDAFEQALIAAYTDAGIDLETQAKARQAARAAVVRFSGSLSSNARFHLSKRAEILAALATSEALEASFRSNGATSARLEALQQAQSSFLADLRAATSANAMAEAKAEYSSKIEDELAAEISVNAAVIAAADAALGGAKATLELALATASTAGAVARAHASFYTSAEAAARSTFTGNDKAILGATVLALLNADL